MLVANREEDPSEAGPDGNNTDSELSFETVLDWRTTDTELDYETHREKMDNQLRNRTSRLRCTERSRPQPTKLLG